MTRSDRRFYAQHILEAIANIEDDLAGHTFDSFCADRRTRQLVERNLEIVSEASRRLPDDLKAGEPEIDWRAIASIGNVLRHDYHRSQPSILWQACRRDLSPLKAAVTRIRRALEAQERS
ncbi:MAG: DUF86 domain-containing protein [Rhodospirillaceae bacterium]|nr:DUF86 domain-containing protein [Rhodospirillaceae bacterium]MDE0618276.1 DUF86 domain-containing protein [Rhodospirillaceae bacterium]MYJ70197.1 DUF86 domain-containing protein [Rhodospirillaceae bacterium]